MKGRFKTPDGKEVKVIEFDEPNNIVYAQFPNGNKIWIGKTEYSTWKSSHTGEVPKEDYVYVPDIPAQMTEEQINSQSKTESDAIQVGEPETISLDETPGDSSEMGEGISQPEEPSQESEIKGEEKTVKPKRKYTKKQNI